MDIDTRTTDVLQSSMLEAIPTGMMLVDRAGYIVQANRRLIETFGWDELPDQLSLTDLLPAQYKQHHSMLVDAFWLDPQARLMGDGRDLTAQHSAGHEFPVEIGLAPWPSDNPTEVLVSVVDITQRKQRELALSEALTELDEFSRVVSHDLRSPVLGLGHLCQWMKDDLAEGDYEQVAEHVQKAADRIGCMSGLVEDLLVYARAGHQRQQFETVDLQLLVREVWVLMSPSSDFTIDVVCDTQTWTTARVPLETVIRNLIGNAIKHHDKGQGHIQIRFRNKPSEGVVEVSDDGPGIPASSAQRVTRLFQTLSDNKPKHSTGIGLAVCRRLVESFGGRIAVSSNANGGACLTFAWPRVNRSDYNQTRG